MSVARALSKLGVCSRAQGERLVEAGEVRVNGTIVRDVSLRVRPEHDVIEVSGARVARVEPVYLMLNKPRGLVTTADDPQGRATIYECFRDATLPFVAPVGRLDKASEGLLLLTNDSRWSSRLLDPASHVDKVYHVQVRGTELAAVMDRSLPASSNERPASDSRSKRSRCCARARAAARGSRSCSTKGRTVSCDGSSPRSA